MSATAWWYTGYWQPKRTALWESRTTKQVKKPARAPAQFTETDLPLIEDFFRYNSFHHFISYRMNIELTSDANNRNQSRAQESLDRTLHGLFPKNDKAKTLKAFASPTLTTDFISKYLEQLDLNRVDKGNYQLDIEFVPRNHPSVLFDREARAVSLWDLNQTKSLKTSIGEKYPPSAIPKTKEFDLIRKIASTDYPNEGQYYQYQGGVISLQLGLDDLKWDAEDIRSEKSDQLEGDLVYRRYFKIVHEDEFSFFLDHPDLAISSSAMVRKHEAVPVFTTVDVSRDFNGHTVQIPKERISIHFGKMLPTQKRKRGFFQRIFGSDDASQFDTGELRLYGRLGKGEAGIEFELVLHTLVFDLGTRTLNPQDSRINVTLKREGISGFDKASATNDIKRILLGPLSADLMKALSLGRFHPALKQNTGGGR